MPETRRLKCSQCSYSVEAEYVNRFGETRSGYWKLRNHYQERHVGSFWEIMRSLPPRAPEDPLSVVREIPKYDEDRADELNFDSLPVIGER